MYVDVTPDYSLRVRSCIDSLIPQGAEVLSINQYNSKKIIESMLEYASGERDFFRITRIDYDFQALFEMLYAADSYEITWRPKGSKKTFSSTLQPAAWEEIQRIPRRNKLEVSLPDYTFKVLEKENVAIMEFNSFRDPKKIKAFADSMFLQLRKKNIGNLIIDIRNNGGGDSQVGDIILRYISRHPFQQMGKSLVRITPTTQRLIGNEKTTPNWYFYDSEKQEELICPLTTKEDNYEGNVYLLISHQTFSSASSFSWAFKEFNMGTIIGKETGGMNVCFGDILSYKLPISGLLCTISYKRFWQYGAEEKDIHGTLPNYEVPQEQALDTALKLIKKSKK